jgi:hypothetical protein
LKNAPWMRRMTMTGDRMIRSSVRRFGIFIVQFSRHQI